MFWLRNKKKYFLIKRSYLGALFKAYEIVGIPITTISEFYFVSDKYNELFNSIFDITTAGDWDCVAAVERLPALHYSVGFIFLSFGIIGFIVEL